MDALSSIGGVTNPDASCAALRSIGSRRMRCIANRRGQAEYPVTATTKREGKGRGDPGSFRRGLSHLIGCSRCHPRSHPGFGSLSVLPDPRNSASATPIERQHRFKSWTGNHLDFCSQARLRESGKAVDPHRGNRLSLSRGGQGPEWTMVLDFRPICSQCPNAGAHCYSSRASSELPLWSATKSHWPKSGRTAGTGGTDSSR